MDEREGLKGLLVLGLAQYRKQLVLMATCSCFFELSETVKLFGFFLKLGFLAGFLN
jgi:hypothetical protein